MDGGRLYIQWDLGIRDHGRQKKCMSVTAYCAIDADYSQKDQFILQLDLPFIGTITDQTSRMATGTWDKV